MRTQSLPASAATAYADLLAALLVAPLPSRGISWFKRPVRGTPYWYLQYAIGGTQRSVYVGPDDPPTRALVERAQSLKAEEQASRPTRERLVATVLAAGGSAPSLAEARVLEAVAQAGVFAVGGVLVGTQAFVVLGNMLGVRWAGPTTRTEDIDIAGQDGHELEVAAPNVTLDLPQVLQDTGAGVLPVPSLDRKHPSTAFSIRGEPLTVSFLTPEFGKPKPGPLYLRCLNLCAEPLRFLEFVLRDTQPAAITSGAGLLVRVPEPARFALHKLVVAQRRPTAFAVKSRKDIEQAAALLEVLADLRPGSISAAMDAARVQGGKFLELVEQGARQLPDDIREKIG